MFRFRKGLSALAALAAATVLGAPAAAHANFAIRATSFNGAGQVTGTQTFTSANGPGASFGATFTLPDFSGALSNTTANNNSTTGTGFSAHSITVNLFYNSTNSTRLFIEILGDSYVNPVNGSFARITSNGSPSTSGLAISSISMTSGVINGNVALAAAPLVGSSGYGALGGQLGGTLGVGSAGTSSSVLVPNPSQGGLFAISTPFTFYQTFNFSGFGSTGQAGSISAGSQVDAVAVPAPAGFELVLSALPVLGGFGWRLRRRMTALAA